MRKVMTREVLLFAGISALVLAGWSPAPLAKKATIARANAEITQRAQFSYSRGWKRGHGAISRRLKGTHGRAKVYRRSLPSEWTDLTIQCLLNQPFVICP